MNCGRICGCHPLEHAIAETIARIEAPIPPPTLREVKQRLQDALDDWKDAGEP